MGCMWRSLDVGVGAWCGGMSGDVGGWVSKFWTDIKVYIPIFTTSWVLCVTFHLDQKWAEWVLQKNASIDKVMIIIIKVCLKQLMLNMLSYFVLVCFTFWYLNWFWNYIGPTNFVNSLLSTKFSRPKSRVLDKHKITQKCPKNNGNYYDLATHFRTSRSAISIID